MISDELKLKLPNININNEITLLPFSKKFISYALKKHLFDGLSRSEIDSSFYGTKKYNGMMSQLLIEYFGLNNDKGIYSGYSFETVDNFLRLQTDQKYVKLADAMNSEIDESMDSHFKIFKKFYITNAKNEDAEEKKLILLDNKFKEEYPLEKILDFSIEDYKTYCYKLEYDKTTYKNIGFSLGIGGSYKYGFYQKKDDKRYRDGNNEIIEDNNVEEYFMNFKKQLYNYLKEFEQSDKWIDPREKYSLLAKTNYSNIWLQKLICSYFPEKVINVYDKTRLIEVATYLDIPIDYNWYPGQMSFEMNKWFRTNIKESKEFHPFYIGNAIYKFFDTSPKEEQIKSSDKFVTGAYNKIYYGTPGCGKSYLVNKEYNKDGNIIFRTTFHPEYSNSDFVGQIIPKLVESGITYEFQEGPFTQALLSAFENPNKENYLIIEEINRGNASAIFGDIFQLLDRNEDGESTYTITNNAIQQYLNKNGINVDRIFIPSNLWIIATMNTSDQNVFTLDTAFKRRWNMHRVPNVFEDNNKLAKMYVPGTTTTWEEFVININNAIVDKNKFGLNSEDKQLGVYFVGENELTKEYSDSKEASEAFAEKVLLYIWEDIAKINPTDWFNGNCNTFDDLLTLFNEKHLDIFKGIFFSKDDNESEE